MKSSTGKMTLNSLDDLFGTKAPTAGLTTDLHEKVIKIHLAKLHSFNNHPFKVRDDSAMQELAESIKQNGVLIPCVVRSVGEGSYELISGHRRKRACELAHIDLVPVIVRELDDDEATMAMVGSNHQREKILLSEKAFAYKMMLDALKRQGARNDLTCAQFEHKPERDKSREKVARIFGVNRNQIQRYIRLTELIPHLLDMVDSNRLPFTVACELSYLTQEYQDVVFEVMSEIRAKPSLEQAKLIRELDQTGCFSRQKIIDLVSTRKPAMAEANLRLPCDLLARCFTTHTQEQIETAVRELLEGLVGNPT